MPSSTGNTSNSITNNHVIDEAVQGGLAAVFQTIAASPLCFYLAQSYDRRHAREKHLPNIPPMRIRPDSPRLYLCAADELTGVDSKEFKLEIPGQDGNIFIVHFHGQLYAYLNHCPHMGVPLNWNADKFLDLSKTLIICGTHGALFRIEDGLCVWGPCVKQSLTALPLELEEGKLYVRLPPF